MPLNLSRWLIAVLLSLFVVPAGVFAQAVDAPLQEIQPASGAFSRGAPIPDWARLAPVPALDAAGRAMVVHLSDVHLRVAPTPAWVSNRVVQANDASMLGALGQVSLQFNPAYQTVKLHRLAILRGGQEMDHTVSVPVKFLQRETQLEQGVYNGVITASMTLPDVRVGDALHVVYSVEGSNPILGPKYSDGASWTEVHPVLHRKVTLISPMDRKIAWRWVGDAQDMPETAPREHVEGAVRRTVFEGRALPAVNLEPGMPADSKPFRWLQFSEYARWEEVGQWATDLFSNADALPAGFAPVMAGLRALPDDAVRAAEALRWVQENIRYHSVQLGESSHRPQPAASVLEKRYGDCKDKSLLLVGMLRALGIEADPALASLRSRKSMNGLLPSPDVFDHVVVRVRLNGVNYFVDPTRGKQAGPIDRMGQHLEEAEVLVAKPDSAGAEIVRSTRRSEVFRNELTEAFALDTFGEDGQLQVNLTVNGLEAEAFRAALPRMDEAARGRWALEGYEKRYPGLQLIAGPTFVDEPTLNQIRIASSFRIPRLAREVNGDWIVRFMAENLRGSVTIPERLSRRSPVAMPSYPATLVYEVRMRWPETVSVITDPGTRTVDSRFFRARMDGAFRGREEIRKVHFEPLLPEVKPAELSALVEDVRKLDRLIGGVLVVQRRDIKRTGMLGLGRQSFMDKFRERSNATVQSTGRALANSQLRGEDLAEALCMRAEAWSDQGDASKALVDAEEAVKQVPESPRAWNCRGNIHFNAGRFEASASDYSRALIMGDDAPNNLYRRGISRYYQGRLELAAEDFARATALQKDESHKVYVQMWHAWTLGMLKRPLPADLEAAARATASGDWPRPALALHAGLWSPEQMMAFVEKKAGDDLHMAQAEAWFYVGQYHKVRGESELAAAAFRKAVDKGVTMYIEHAAATFELQRTEAR